MWERCSVAAEPEAAGGLLLETLQRGEAVAASRPWPRHDVDLETWELLTLGLAERRWSLLGLWGDASAVHMALYEGASRAIAIASLACPEGRFPSVGLTHAPAQRLERTIADLFGLVPVEAPDGRAWLDHGRWPRRHPLGAGGPHDGAPTPYAFLPAEGEGLHQIPVGPVHAGIIEPGGFRFTANGETVVRLEERLGYVHKGIESLMAGATLETAVRLAGRVSGDSTVAYALAFARAVEAATGTAVPERAVFLRALMAELERLANHLGDIGAICNDASFTLLNAQFGILREGVLRAAQGCFGHRLMRDCIVPGGVTTGLRADGQVLRALMAEIRRMLPRLFNIYENTASLQDRTASTGIVSSELAEAFAAGGYVGRASGRDFDARRDIAYPPYDRLSFPVPVLTEGDVNARVWIRIREIEASLSLVEQMIEPCRQGELSAAVAAGPGEGMALVEGFRGDILVWLRLGADGRVERCHLRDPSWFQWPLLEAAIEGNIVADFPLCNKSFNCSYSGHDL
jgi:Ni,Fe-hydrogenase III large subunit